MISLIDREIERVENSNSVNQSFIEGAVDFIRTYADRTHNGKEEGILFRELSERKLSRADAIMINELIQEHAYGRAAVEKLVITSDAYHKGDTKALPFVVMCMRKLVDFYPGHIAREDKIFFPSVMAYFSDSEQQSMLDEFSGFDKKILHLKYIAVVEFFEGRGRPSVAPAAVV